MPSTGPADDARWQALASELTLAEARELVELLEAAKVGARLVEIRGGESWAVAVPDADVPVAAGVAEHFLDWFRPEAEGDVDEAECVAALDDPHEPDFESQLERERRSRTNQRRLLAAGITLAAVSVLGVIAFRIATWLLG